MATVIDALVVTLGFDASQFKPNAQAARLELAITVEQANRAAKQIEASGKTAANFFTKLRTEALGLLALFLGGKGVGAFVADTVTSLSALGRAAHNINNMPIAELAAFRNMIERTGGSGASAEAALRGLTDAMQRLNTMGDKTILPGLQAIGGQTTDNAMQLIRKFTAFAADPRNSPARVNQIGALLNIPQDVIDRLNKGVAGLDAAMTESRRLDQMTPGMSDRAQALQAAWGGFREAADGLGRELLDLVAPILTDLLNLLKDGVVWVNTIAHEFPGWARGVVVVTTAVLSLTAAMKAFAVARMLMSLGSGASLLGGGTGALAAAASGVGAVTTGIGALTSALTLLLGPLAAVAAWYTALHISPAAGAEELAAEKKHTEDRAREHPELVVPSEPKPDPAQEWYRRNVPQWLRHRNAANDDSGGGRARSTAPLAPDIEAEIRRQAAIKGLDADHMVRLARAEGGGYDKVSGAGAIGPMQLMPGTARDLRVDPHDWRQNIEGGLRHYRANLDKFQGNYRAADAAYNAGQNAASVRRFAATGDASGLPRETRDYVATINKPGPAMAAARPPALDPAVVARARPPVPPVAPQQMASADTANTTTIGAITINTQATDANGIARGIGPAIRRRTLVAQATTGLA